MHTFTSALRLTSGALSRVGQPVLYMISAGDRDQIIRERGQAGSATAHGNVPGDGQALPGIIVGDWGGSANLQVFLDGTDSYWPTSRPEYRGDDEPTDPNNWGQGRWHYELDGKEVTKEFVDQLAGPNDVGMGESAVGRVVRTWEPDARGTWILR